MKRIVIFFMILATAAAGFAQNKNKKEKMKVDFYGIDFSAVNVVGAEETPEKFIEAFERINGLLISEPNKYDAGKYLGLEVLSIDCETAVLQTARLKDIKFKDKTSSGIDLQNIINNYPSTPDKGLLIIAKELNKPQNKGVFIAVLYEGANKQIISQKEFSGKAGGFGLRNFWAGALYNGLKKAK